MTRISDARRRPARELLSCCLEQQFEMVVSPRSHRTDAAGVFRPAEDRAQFARQRGVDFAAVRARA